MIPIVPEWPKDAYIAPDEKVEFHLADDIFVKMIALDRQGRICKGHKHTFDHTSFLATGKLRLWEDGVFMGDFTAPTGILIKKEVSHMMVALEDNTVFFCIHNTHGCAEGDEGKTLVIPDEDRTS